MDSHERLVDLLVSAVAICPAFDHADIVSENLEMNARGSSIDDGLYEELESDALGPGNVMPVPFPVSNEVPSTLTVDNHNSDAGTHIGEGVKVKDWVLGQNGNSGQGRRR